MKFLITAILGPAVLAAGVFIGQATANARPPVYETRTVTETVTSPRCITDVSSAVRYMQWSTRAGHYVNLIVPRHTVSPPRTRCHP